MLKHAKNRNLLIYHKIDILVDIIIEFISRPKPNSRYGCISLLVYSIGLLSRTAWLISNQ